MSTDRRKIPVASCENSIPNIPYIKTLSDFALLSKISDKLKVLLLVAKDHDRDIVGRAVLPCSFLEGKALFIIGEFAC